MPDEPLEPAEAPEPEVMAGRTLAGRTLAAAERVRILREQIEEARARHRSVDIGLATVERDSEIGGSLLAGALAYRLFVFLLPFAVFLVVGLGLYADVCIGSLFQHRLEPWGASVRGGAKLSVVRLPPAADP